MAVASGRLTGVKFLPQDTVQLPPGELRQFAAGACPAGLSPDVRERLGCTDRARPTRNTVTRYLAGVKALMVQPLVCGGKRMYRIALRYGAAADILGPAPYPQDPSS